jgi:hypothetical protein
LRSSLLPASWPNSTLPRCLPEPTEDPGSRCSTVSNLETISKILTTTAARRLSREATAKTLLRVAAIRRSRCVLRDRRFSALLPLFLRIDSSICENASEGFRKGGRQEYGGPVFTPSSRKHVRRRLRERARTENDWTTSPDFPELSVLFNDFSTVLRQLCHHPLDVDAVDDLLHGWQDLAGMP